MLEKIKNRFCGKDKRNFECQSGMASKFAAKLEAKASGSGLDGSGGAGTDAGAATNTALHVDIRDGSLSINRKGTLATRAVAACTLNTVGAGQDGTCRAKQTNIGNLRAGAAVRTVRDGEFEHVVKERGVTIHAAEPFADFGFCQNLLDIFKKFWSRNGLHGAGLCSSACFNEKNVTGDLCHSGMCVLHKFSVPDTCPRFFDLCQKSELESRFWRFFGVVFGLRHVPVPDDFTHALGHAADNSLDRGQWKP